MKKTQLLNEIMGVPKVLDFWVDYFSYILAGMAKGIVLKDEIEESGITYLNDENEEVEGVAYRSRARMEGKEFMDWVLKLGGYEDLKALLTDPKFKQFPLYKPDVTLTLYFMPKEIVENFAEASHSYDVTKNALSKIGNNEILVNQNFGFQIYLTLEDLDKLDVEVLRKKLKPTISHELLHAYEGYQRVKTSGDPYQGRETFLNAAVRLMSDEKYPQWKQFLHLVYLHLGFEINARIPQFYYDIKDKDIKNYDEFMTELKKSSAWKELQMLENFDAQKFINSFKAKGLDLVEILQDLGKQIERGSQGLPTIKPTKSPEEGMKHLIQGWDYVLQMLNSQIKATGVYKGKLMDLVPLKAMEDPYEFFKFFEKRFHKKADRFKRKLYRISTLVIDKNLV